MASSEASGSGNSCDIRPVSGDLRTLQPLDVHDCHNLAQRWQRWKRAFTFYADGMGIKDDNQKRCLMLHLAGGSLQDLYSSLVSDGDNTPTYNETVSKLDDHFMPKINIPFERHVFHQLTQTGTESVAQYVCKLRHLAANCQFESPDDNIRDQVVDKCYSTALRRKFLEKEGLTLVDVLKIANAHEMVNAQCNAMVGKEENSRVSAVAARRPQHRKFVGTGTGTIVKECFACGRKGHYKQDDCCPAKGKTCNNCGKIGHFQIKCRSKFSNNGARSKPKGKKQSSHATNSVEESRADEDEYTFSIMSKQQKGCVYISVGGVDMEVMIDSGASCNILSRETWEWLKKCKVKATQVTKGSSKKLFGYGNDKPLPIIGTFVAKVISDESEQQTTAEFAVVSCGGNSLLGRETAEDLGLLHVGPLKVNHVQDDITKQYSNLFRGIGLLKDYKLSLHIDKSVRPVAQPVRRIPFQLRGKVKQKLDELFKADIIEEVPEGPTDWISPLVVIPKSDGDVRICVDMRRANEAIIRERHPIPTVEELLLDLNGSTVFSKLDLKWGFHQILLDEDSRYITTFVTHDGLYRYKRLMFGMNSAPEKYQKIIRDVLKNCAGVANIADDVIIHGKSMEEHDKRLFEVLDKLSEAGLTLNSRKCKFRLPRLTFFGHDLNKRGITPSEEKVAAIQDAEPPKSANEARSFMGLVQYSARFIPNLATIARPIYEVTKKDTEFVWNKSQQVAFEELKKMMTKSDTLAYFRNECKTRVIADASPIGLGAVLTQEQDGEWRIISYASRSLSDVERRYSQTEKEALALVWACERFNLYIFGKEFELETDHKPLEYIYSKKSKLSARVERWVLRLQGYDFKVIYRPGKTNIADALSRLNSKTHRDTGDKYDFVKFVAENSTPRALTPREIEQESAKDLELQSIRELVKSGDWSKCTNTSFLHVKDELGTCGKMLLRGTRIVIPKALRDKVLKLAHEGHQGIVKTKNRLRTKVWWPKIDKDAEKMCRTCHGCQVTSSVSRPDPIARVLPPNRPWQDCALDILGPLPSGENVMVIVDYYSRFFEIAILKTVTSTKIVEALLPIFSRFGNPFSLRTDNGPQLVSAEFETFLKEQGIQHVKTTPLWPQANGEVERQNRTLMRAIRIAQVEKKDWRFEINKFLIAYRSTPQVTTGASPYYMMFGREMRTKLPELRGDPELVDEEIRDRDWENKLKGKMYTDQKRRAVCSDFSVGDEVLVRGQKSNKFSTTYDPVPHTVISRNNEEITVQNQDGVELTRNASFLRPYIRDDTLCENEGEIRDTDNVNDSELNLNGENTLDRDSIGHTPTSVRAKSSRTINKPARYRD